MNIAKSVFFLTSLALGPSAIASSDSYTQREVLDFSDMYNFEGEGLSKKKPCEVSRFESKFQQKKANLGQDGFKNVRLISFEGDLLNTETFHEVTKFLLQEPDVFNSNSLEALVLKGNRLTPDVAATFIKWFNFSSEIWIDVIGNTDIALKNVGSLINDFKKQSEISGDEFSSFVQQYAGRIIFMNGAYARNIKSRYKRGASPIKVYSDLVVEKLIPDNWYDKHLTYYDGPYRKLQNYKKEMQALRFRDWWKSPAPRVLKTNSDLPETQRSKIENADSELQGKIDVVDARLKNINLNKVD